MPIYGRFYPSKDVFHCQTWQMNGTQYEELTNSNSTYYWNWFYYPRRHQNLPEDENLYNLQYISYGSNTSSLWALK